MSVLHKHGVLGDVKGKQMDRAQRSVIESVKAQATGKYSKQPTDLLYRASDVKVQIYAHRADNNIIIDRMRISEYDADKSSVNFSAMQNDLNALFGRSS